MYFLEPAGSKGQWCLDDYQFLPFLWGSSQLTDDGPIEPKQAIDERYYRGLADDYLYLGAIKYINEVKTGPFFEHSSTLYDISNVAHWSKVDQGMLKMYHGEVCCTQMDFSWRCSLLFQVLDKFPISVSNDKCTSFVGTLCRIWETKKILCLYTMNHHVIRNAVPHCSAHSVRQTDFFRSGRQNTWRWSFQETHSSLNSQSFGKGTARGSRDCAWITGNGISFLNICF